MARGRIDDFGQITPAKPVEHAGPCRTFKRHRPDLSHAVVVEHTRSMPESFKLSARCGNAAAGFARDHEQAYFRPSKIETLFVGSFGESQRISRRAANDGRFAFQDLVESRGAA